MKLYVTRGSPYARLARIVVVEKGLEDRVETIEAKTRTAGSPYYQNCGDSAFNSPEGVLDRCSVTVILT
jgi:hypothetical protein